MIAKGDTKFVANDLGPDYVQFWHLNKKLKVNWKFQFLGRHSLMADLRIPFQFVNCSISPFSVIKTFYHYCFLWHHFSKLLQTFIACFKRDFRHSMLDSDIHCLTMFGTPWHRWATLGTARHHWAVLSLVWYSVATSAWEGQFSVCRSVDIQTSFT